jgi:hypothetical protein
MPSTDVQRQRTIRKRAPAARWSDKEIETLLAGVLDAKDNGLRSENGFKSSVWSSLAAGFGDPLKKANRVCESKWARLKGDYRAVKFLRNLSGFGWDATKSLVTAESGVWEELAQKYPEMLKWRFTRFPWFDDVLDILDDSLPMDNYSFVAVNHIAIDNDHASPDDIELLQEPTRTSLTTSPSPSSNKGSDSLELRGTQSQRRSPESDLPPAKKRKASERSIMEKMGKGIMAVADAMKQTPEVLHKDTVDSTLQGQAQLKVQTEACLTEEGQLLMLEQFMDLALARTYLSIQNDSLRVKFLKKQVEKHDSNYFIDPY